MKESLLKQCVHAVGKAMKWSFIVFFVVSLVFLAVVAFSSVTVPSVVCDMVLDQLTPTNLVVHCDRVACGLRRGLTVEGLRVYDLGCASPLAPMVSFERIDVNARRREVRVVGARYPRLPDGYYAPGNTERNARVEAEFPALPTFRLVLERADILSVRPRRVTADVTVREHRVDFANMRLEWSEPDCARGLDGFCFVDLDRQEVHGKVGGVATQAQIRPMIVALDVPVALPYMDGFTEVPEPVDAGCEWKVNLVNNDFDLWLDLKPKMGRYNTVPMDWATGKIHLHSYTRGTWLNYLTEVGPIDSVNGKGQNLNGTVSILGTNGYNEVSVVAKSALPVADILKIGGFTGHYVEDDVVGKMDGRLVFRFPRSMTNNYEVLNGEGHATVKDGHLLRLPLFAGLTSLLADKVPGVNYLVEQSEATIDYTIENGVVRTEGFLIEGGVFSISMKGSFDAVRNRLDYTVLVRFTRKDSAMGRYFIRPVTWPFSKLLLEFRLRGTPEKPEWEYVSIIDRIMDALK